MRAIRLRFSVGIFTAGATLLAVGSGLVGLLPALEIPGGILFAAGLVLTVYGVVTLEARPVVVHQTWDHGRMYRALEQAPTDAVVRILQTWFLEEDFVEKLQGILLQNRQFDLRVMLMDPDPDPDADAEDAQRPDLVAA